VSVAFCSEREERQAVPRPKHHLLTAVGFVLATTFLGAAITALIARSILISTAITHLQTYASDFLAEDDKVAANINDTLDAADASTAPPCSEADFVILRHLLFRSPYIKDIGRKQDGRFLCSVIAGIVPHPVVASHRGFTPQGSHNVIYNVPIDIDNNFHGEIVASDRSNVILPPDTFDAFYRLPMFFSAAVIDAGKGTMVTTYSNAPVPPQLDLILASGATHRGSYLFYSRCSGTRPNCVLTGIPYREIWRPNRPLVITSVLSGALIGLAFSGTALFMDSRRRTLASQLRRAIRRKDLTVLYQPIVDVSTGATIGAEALVRWTDEDGAPVLPELFISLAESHGFVGTITTFVLQCVLKDLGDLLRANPAFQVSINMSSQDLTDPNFLPRLDSLLHAHRVPAASIGIELTERSTSDRETVIEAIRQLHARGHIVYIDDFGTGYSSLSYLNELSADVIKVDRSFTQTIGTHSITASILPQILSMARTLNLRIVVEGVERPEQAAYLALEEGHISAQGWHFGAPTTPQALKARLAQTT
jgi:sensor c-di-GMP phosphodiesterase-like protein